MSNLFLVEELTRTDCFSLNTGSFQNTHRANLSVYVVLYDVDLGFKVKSMVNSNTQYVMVRLILNWILISFSIIWVQCHIITKRFSMF